MLRGPHLADSVSSLVQNFQPFPSNQSAMQPGPRSFELHEYQGLDQSSTLPVPPPKQMVRSRWQEFHWTIEILSCIFAAIILVALVSILAIYHDGPQPNWPHPISINTIIAIFTVAFKALLLKPVVEGLSQFKWLWFSRPKELSDLELFDQATRGPWGSACLLYDSLIKLEKRYLAIFGALLIIVALAIDPLSQGIVRYFSCAIPSLNTVAQIPRTNNYTTVGAYISTESFQLDAPMTVAVYTGLLDPPTASSVQIQCPTGNCTFPSATDGATFSSMSMCSSCDNITAMIISEESPKQDKKWTLSLPSGVRLDEWLTSSHLSGTVLNATGVANKGMESFAFEALMLQADESCKTNNKDHSYPCSSHGHSRRKSFAIRCSLEPCVKTYHANVSRFDYQETCLKSERLGPYSHSAVLANKTTLRKGTWEDCKPSKEETRTNTFQYQKRTTDDYTTWNFTLEEPLWYPPDCVWVFGYNANRTIRRFLYSQLEGSVSIAAKAAEPSSELLWMKNLWRNGTADMNTVHASMEGLALAMTSQMRQSPDPTEKLRFVTGTVYDSVTCVEVRWIWLLYPFIALFLTVIFLALAIFQGRATHQPWHNDWKSSSLALLFHGLEPETREKYGPVPKQKDMIEAAEKIRVQLVQGEEGWRFSEARQPADEEDGMAARVSAEARSDTTSLNALGRPSLRVSQTSTASLLAPSVSYDSAISTPRSQSPQPSPRRSTTI
ncbi:hypothetical protein HDK90DRAFT_68222 [Phyllosticta capitalensis]|uniref:Uncharacterized protein n=1 Tax=Phyllosticta capitalensis TaxID=121624 RepID=A0ABR1YCD5_9PEZI